MIEMTDEKFLRVWGKARRRGYWVFTLTKVLPTGLACAASYAGTSWILNKPINLLTPATIIGTATIVSLAVGPSVWRSREEKYRRLVSGRSAQVFD